MRILQVNLENTWRGGERQTLFTLEGLRADGESAELLCRKGSPLWEMASNAGLAVHPVSKTLGALRFLSRHGKHYDVIHAQSAQAHSLAVLAKPLHGRPVIYTRRVDFKPRGLSARLKYHCTERIVAISGAIADILAEFGAGDVPVIPSATKPYDHELTRQAAEQELRDAYGLGRRRILGTAAAFAPHKDPLTMVRAMHELTRLRGRDFAFLHFGDGELLAKARQEAEALGLGEVYHFAGFSDRIRDFLQAFEVFVMSSREEGMGSTVLDAFLEQVPVAATDAGGLGPLVSGRGVVCPAENPTALANSVNQLLENPALRQECAQAALAYVNEHHTIEKMTADYRRIYQEMAESAA